MIQVQSKKLTAHLYVKMLLEIKIYQKKKHHLYEKQKIKDYKILQSMCSL